MKYRRESLLIFVAAWAIAAPAWAYIDPSAGSYLLQILAAGFFGAMFALRLFWHRIKGFFSRQRPTKGQGSGGSDERGADSASG